MNFYHRFVKNCASIIKALKDLSTIVKDEACKLQWNDQADDSITTTLLFHPKQETPTSIMTDASDHAIRAVLQQYVDQQ